MVFISSIPKLFSGPTLSHVGSTTFSLLRGILGTLRDKGSQVDNAVLEIPPLDGPTTC